MLLAGCEYINSAMPPTPSPFPTVAQLPTVTPVTPSPEPPPTRTPRPTPTTTATPETALEATIAVGANMRTGPSVDFEIITSLVADTDVTLRGQNNGWYKVVLTDGTEGWMSAQVLEVPPDAAAILPTVEPDE
jgi:hypothetical protein